MRDRVRLNKPQRRSLACLVAIALVQAVFWGVWGVGDYGVLRVVLTCAFLAVAVGGVVLLVRDRGIRWTR